MNVCKCSLEYPALRTNFHQFVVLPLSKREREYLMDTFFDIRPDLPPKPRMVLYGR